jgi:hypothetical protein
MHQSRTTETQGNHDLFDAFGQPGCPICTVAQVSVERYVSSTNYDSVSDPEIRKHFEASQGFCNLHAHQWLQSAFILGTANIYRDVLLVTSSDLQKRSFTGRPLSQRVGSFLGRQKSVESLIGPTELCPACAILQETESRLLATLLHGLPDPAFRSAYAASAGLCVPHLRVALASATRQESFDSLKERAVRTQQTLIAHLEETIRKHDYRFRHEEAGEEKGSAARAVAHVAGADGIAEPADR